MKTPTLSSTSAFVAMPVIIAMLLFSSTSFAHSSISHSRAHHGSHENTYVIVNNNGLARKYFNYSYDQRRARKLSKYYRTNNRVLKNTKRYRHSYQGNYRRYSRHYNDCPTTYHRH